MKRVAVDIGGTFTDIVYIDDDTMNIVVDKTRSTPWDIGQAVTEAIKKARIDMSAIALFIHGTTVGVNTIVQRKGAKVGLITTSGFTDVLEMARGDRPELYNYLWKKPKPLVPRNLRLGVRERTNYLGEIVEKLDEKQLAEIVGKLKREGVEAVAVCLLHSYANPENEQRIGGEINEVWPEASVALSHLVSREYREYERTSTTVINAYIEKAVVGYLNRLSANLKELGFTGQLLISGPSGVLGIEAVKEKALYTIASGPIGGAAGAAHLAGLCGIKDLLTMDIGGTSIDMSIIKDGVNVERHQSEVMGYPVLMAGVDIRAIGAGGGSIARVDAAGLLTVGPESAGADPGPMSYGLGGTEPTVTDAALVNGLIDPDYFLGGEVSVDVELAKKGVKDVADKLGLSLNEAADGILSVARNNMINTISEILIGQGYDPRDFAIMAYGGAGGLFAANIAKDMSISRVVVPMAPGVFSAQGILTMNLVHTYARAYARSVDGLDIKELEGIYTEMENSALQILATEGISRDSIEFARSLDMCYEGQHYYIETPVPNVTLEAAAKTGIRDSYERLHEIRYGHRIQAPMLTINVRLRATGRIKETPVAEIEAGKDIPQSAVKQKRKIYLDGQLVESQIYERDQMLCGNTITGPAIIEEPFHTTVVMAGQTLQVDKLGNLIIHTGGA
jgi:N-methylhydantoinase A